MTTITHVFTLIETQLSSFEKHVTICNGKTRHEISLWRDTENRYDWHFANSVRPKVARFLDEKTARLDLVSVILAKD